MGLNRLGGFLRRHHKIALDSNIFIYELDANPRYATYARHAFQWLAEPHHSAVTSTLTMTEVLTRPYAVGAPRQANEYYGLLSNYPHLDWIAPDLVTADLAAQFRARHRMRNRTRFKPRPRFSRARPGSSQTIPCSNGWRVLKR